MYITGLQLRGFEEEEEDSLPTDDFRESSKRVNQQLDADLGKTALVLLHFCIVLFQSVQLLNPRVN